MISILVLVLKFIPYDFDIDIGIESPMMNYRSRSRNRKYLFKVSNLDRKFCVVSNGIEFILFSTVQEV